MGKGYGIVSCLYCGEKFERKHPHQIYCSKQHQKQFGHYKWLNQKGNRAKNRDYQRTRQRELQTKVYALLGNCCAGCGETDPIVLNIDHIEPVGKHRRNTYQIYYEIMQTPEEDVKKKYQLLCRNCNWRKLIVNNERQLKTLVYAYKWEVDLLNAKLASLEQLVKNNGSNHTNKPRQQWSIKNDFELAQKIIDSQNRTFIKGTGKIDALVLRVVFQKELGISISHNKAYSIKKILETQFNGQVSSQV